MGEIKKPLFVISSAFDTYSGYGARSRDLIKAIIELDKYDVRLIAQRWGNTPWNFCRDNKEWGFMLEHLFKKEDSKIKPDIWMQITIPSEFRPIGKFNIGVTAGIEATACPGEWIEGLNRMDVNWTSSGFSQKNLLNLKFDRKKGNMLDGILKLEKPLHVIFEGADLGMYKPLKPSEIKNIDLSEVKESKAFLNVGHWMQGLIGEDRKNIGLLIREFYNTFQNKKDPPALILKASMGPSSYVSKNKILDKIRDIKDEMGGAKLPNVYLLNGDFSDSEMNELYNHPKIKAMISLTKGEGFGRPLLEFSLTGKPIIASNWSGHLDFLNKEFTNLVYGELKPIHKTAINQWLVQGAQWFSPNISQARDMMKEVISKPKKYNEMAKRQKHYAKTNFSFEQMKDLIDVTLEDHLKNVPKEVKLELPKLKKVE